MVNFSDAYRMLTGSFPKAESFSAEATFEGESKDGRKKLGFSIAKRSLTGVA